MDRLLLDGTLTLDPPNAATLRIMASVNLMGRPATSPLPSFLDRERLEPVRVALTA